MQKTISINELDNIKPNRWDYPKHIGNTFDALIAEDEFNDFQALVSCKRCGKEFKRKYIKQVFCSRDCVSKYRIRLKEMKSRHGDAFTNWLKDKI